MISLVDVEDQPRRLADDEDDHNGEQEGRHGLVPTVAGAQGVVKGCVAGKKLYNEYCCLSTSHPLLQISCCCLPSKSFKNRVV